jgi:hypothetical protein
MASSNRYLIVNNDSGAIIGFRKQLNDANEITDID